jgi:hypothetical protein
MKGRMLRCLSAAVLGAAIALPNLAMAFRADGGFDGMHGCISAAAASVAVECISVDSLAVASVGAWSPGGARSCLAQDALLAHPLPASASPSTDSTTSADSTTFHSGAGSSSGITAPQQLPFRRCAVCRGLGLALRLRQRAVLAAGMDWLQLAVDERLLWLRLWLLNNRKCYGAVRSSRICKVEGK